MAMLSLFLSLMKLYSVYLGNTQIFRQSYRVDFTNYPTCLILYGWCNVSRKSMARLDDDLRLKKMENCGSDCLTFCPCKLHYNTGTSPIGLLSNFKVSNVDFNLPNIQTSSLIVSL